MVKGKCRKYEWYGNCSYCNQKVKLYCLLGDYDIMYYAKDHKHNGRRCKGVDCLVHHVGPSKYPPLTGKG